MSVIPVLYDRLSDDACVASRRAVDDPSSTDRRNAVRCERDRVATPPQREPSLCRLPKSVFGEGEWCPEGSGIAYLSLDSASVSRAFTLGIAFLEGCPV